jgi:UDP-N-acetylmuramate: L-alanyl-gamma-D-glutamyl-meso-diaminopimelate ligase
MKLHILGICGTFMGGVAALARELGYTVEGSDQNIYPPMSDQLAALGIALKSGYAPEHLGSADPAAAPDLVVVGNAMSRGNAAVEYLLNARLPYVSGPQWIGENVLASRRVFAVAGTHGKTTTTAMLAWILEVCGRSPGFLVGGVPENFGVSARLGGSTLSPQPSALIASLPPSAPSRKRRKGSRCWQRQQISWWKRTNTIRRFSTSARSSSTTARRSRSSTISNSITRISFRT